MTDFIKLHKQLENHPGKKAHDKWSNLSISYNGVYKVNRTQLLHHLDSPNHNPQLFEELWQNVRPQTVKDAYQSEYIRLLHNYIAAGSSLIDHSRRFIKEYSDSDFNKDYDEKRQIVAATFEHLFLTGMRNYIVHRDIPPIGWEMKISNNTATDQYEPTLSVVALLEWDKWNSTVKSTLLSNKPNLKLVPVIEAHGKLIDDFYAWIFSKFEELHGPELKSLSDLVKQLRNPRI